MTQQRDRPTRRKPNHPANDGAMQPGFDAFPPSDQWEHWTERDPKAADGQQQRDYTIVPTTCFNCESACGLLAYVDKKTGEVRKFEGNPAHPGSRGRNCAKGPATLNQTEDPERILYPMRRVGPRGGGGWERCTWDDALDDLAGRIRAALTRGRAEQGHVPRRPARARTASRSGSWPRGASTATTRIPTSARPAAAPATPSGWASTGPRPTTPTPRSSS